MDTYFRTECICSQTKPSKKSMMHVQDRHCHTPCPKNEMQNCGGETYTSVYRTGLAPRNGKFTLLKIIYNYISKYII